jgi:hypothetical protein
MRGRGTAIDLCQARRGAFRLRQVNTTGDPPPRKATHRKDTDLGYCTSVNCHPIGRCA